jgi:hypothetical protein
MLINSHKAIAKNMIRNITRNILYFNTNLADLGLYKVQIRWFKRLEYWFRSGGEWR